MYVFMNYVLNTFLNGIAIAAYRSKKEEGVYLVSIEVAHSSSRQIQARMSKERFEGFIDEIRDIERKQGIVCAYQTARNTLTIWGDK